MNDEYTVKVEIAPKISSSLTERDLILPTFQVRLLSHIPEIGKQSGILFRVTSPDYKFECGFTKNDFYLLRNSDRASCPISEIYSKKIELYEIIWTPEQLSVIVGSKMDDNLQQSILSTSRTFPPTKLLDWARRKSIIPKTKYDNEHEFHNEVLLAFQRVAEIIDSQNMASSFWNVMNSKTKKPKLETDNQKTILGLLDSIAEAKNFIISPESPTSGGNLDFLVSGILKSDAFVHFCVEVKHAHSEKLEHGLTTQLPAYMDGKNCEYGMYLILYFKGSDFDEPKFASDSDDMYYHLSSKIPDTNKKIRLLVIDVAYKIPPSKL